MEWFSGYTVAFAVLIAGFLFVITLTLYLKSNKYKKSNKISAKPIVIASLFVIALFLVFAIQADRENNPYYEIASGCKEVVEVTPTDVPTLSPTSVSTATSSPTNHPTATPTPTIPNTPPPGWIEITEYDIIKFELPSTLEKVDSDRMVIYKDTHIALTIIKDEVDDSTDWWPAYKRTLYNNSFEEIDEYETQQDGTTIYHIEYQVKPESSSLHCVTTAFSDDSNIYIITIICNKNKYKKEKVNIARIVNSINIDVTKNADLEMTSMVSHGLEYLIPKTWKKETVEDCTYYTHDDCYLMVYKSKVDKEPIEVWNDYDKKFLNGYYFYRSEDIYINENKMDYIEYLSSDETNHSATFIFIYDKHMYFFTIVTPNNDDIFIENKEILINTMHTISKAS